MGKVEPNCYERWEGFDFSLFPVYVEVKVEDVFRGNVYVPPCFIMKSIFSFVVVDKERNNVIYCVKRA